MDQSIQDSAAPRIFKENVQTKSALIICNNENNPIRAQSSVLQSCKLQVGLDGQVPDVDKYELGGGL